LVPTWTVGKAFDPGNVRIVTLGVGQHDDRAGGARALGFGSSGSLLGRTLPIWQRMPELPYSAWSGAAPGSWLARWLAACADLEDLFAHHHLLDAIIEEVDGRTIRVGERWLIDFASCNYLGLDLDREVIEAIPAYLDRWGTHPSWSRMLGSPALYRQIETRLTELLVSADSLLLPTLTHIHASVIPVPASDGTIFVDSHAHKTIWDGCVAARAHGATVVRYAHDDPETLERGAAPPPPGPPPGLHGRGQLEDRRSALHVR
jgi:hypothetical protein